MDQKVHDYLLIFELFQIYIFGFIGSLGDPFHDGIRMAKLVMLNDLFHLCQSTTVVCHVGGQDQVNSSLPEMPVLLPAKLFHKLAII